MAPQSYQLVMKSGPTPDKAFPLDKNEIYIGRDISTDVVINDVEVSRRHARLILQASGYVLEDLGSTNGTFVNGRRLTGSHPLRTGETIMLGESITLTFDTATFDPDATVVGAAGPTAVPPTKVETPREIYTPPSPPPQPYYSGRIPQSQEFEPQQEKKSSQKWLWASCGCLVVLACLVLAAVIWYIDANFLWCNLLPFLPGC